MTQIKNLKFIIVTVALLIAFGALIITSLRSPVAYDPFWHLQMGKDWIENGLSPWVDHYSFTYNGHAITNPPVIFQAILYFLTSQLGLVPGFIALKLLSFLLALGAALLLLRQMKAPAIIYALIMPMIVLLLQLRAMVRPELFSYTLSIVALMFYFRAGKSITMRNMIPIVALMWFWSFYLSSVVGYIIFFGFFLDCAKTQAESRAHPSMWVKWLMWGLLLLAVGFLNPSLTHPLIQAVTFPSEWKILILEYLPSGRGFKAIAGIYVLALFAVLTLVLALRQRKFGILVIALVLTYSAIMMRRMVTPSGIVIVMMLANLLIEGNYFSQLKLVRNKLWTRTIWFVSLVLIGVTLYSNVESARYFIKENQTFLGRYPTAIADYMLENHKTGRILNSYGMGGYLIYRLTPQNQVYIDGRTQILYPLEHMQRFKVVFKTTDPEVLREELDKYSIDQVIWRYTQSRHNLIQDMGGFGLDFLEPRSVLYTRGPSNFALLGKLLANPECWRPDMLDQLNIERQKMDDILPEYSPLFPFANLVVGYSNAKDGKAFIDENIDGDKWFDEMRRFAGYRFLESGEYDLVVNLLGGVEFLNRKDFFASAFAKIMVGDIDTAARILEDFSNREWVGLKPEEMFIQYKLYQLLSMQRDLSTVERENSLALKAKLLVLGYDNLGPEHVIDVGSFCTS